jgi:hypothetical protein
MDPVLRHKVADLAEMGDGARGDARESRASISSPRDRVTAETQSRNPVNVNEIEGLRSVGSLERRLPWW